VGRASAARSDARRAAVLSGLARDLRALALDRSSLAQGT
jgi:hypothetical protein